MYARAGLFVSKYSPTPSGLLWSVTRDNAQIHTKAVLQHRASIAGNVPQILEVFGAVALLVAAFVIYNTFTILVAQRIRQVALLRCIGAGKGQVFGATVAEAALVGLIGSALGVLAGIGVAQGLHAVVAATSSTKLPPGGIVVSGGVIALGMAVGFVVTIVSAVLPVGPANAQRSALVSCAMDSHNDSSVARAPSRS